MRLLMCAVLAGISAVNSAGAQQLRIIPVPPHVAPQWTPLPDLPQVSYAPNLPTDVFRHRGRYYLFWEGLWYGSKGLKGPWLLVDPPPPVLSQINPTYFKTLPKREAQTPGAGAPGRPAPEEVLLTPEGKPAVPPPVAPTPPTPPTDVQAPTSPQPVTPPQPVSPPQPPETAPPPEPQPQAQPPESQESAPQAVPEGPMPKAM